MSAPPVVDHLVGKTVGHYTILAKLGGGGMGVVYKALDGRLGRLVALKFLPPQWSHDETAKQRFIREAQAASASDHPHICTVHAIETTDDGQLFIVMGHYEGETLKRKLETGPLSVPEALQIAAQVADGLARAHAHGVVHRDIKPGNLIITEDGVRILDFGLAKFADSLQLTIAGSTFGTVAYMSPEQSRGDEADARSDIWAVGVVLFEMLTGELPFKGTYVEAISHAIRNDPLPPIGTAERPIPEAVERLVRRALEKDPDCRFQSARELMQDLRLLQGRTAPLDLRDSERRPITASTIFRLLAGSSQRLKTGRVLATGLSIVAVVVGAYLWLLRPVERVSVAIAPVANHTGDSELDDYRLALTEALIGELGGSPTIRVIPFVRLAEVVHPFATDARDVSGADAIQAITTSSGARIVVVPTIEYRNGTWLAQARLLGPDTRSAANTYETEPVTSSLPKDSSYRLMTSLGDIIQSHVKGNGLGRSSRRRPARFRNIEAARAFAEGLSSYEQLEYAAALAAFRRAASEDDQRPATHAWLSRVLLVLSRGNEAAGAGQRARQLVTTDTPDADLAVIVAMSAESRADSRAAEEAYRRLISFEPGDPVAHVELADFLKRQNRYQEAISEYQEVLRLDRLYIRPHVDLCQLQTRLDNYSRAEEEAQSALEKYRVGGNRSGEAQALLCLGEVQRVQAGARLPDARRNVEAAHDILESLGQANNLSRAYQYLGAVATAERNYVKAAQYFGEALSRSRQIGNPQIEGLELMNLGVTYDQLGRRAEALSYYRQSRDVFQQIGDERRAAEQQVNAAALVVRYGTDQGEALRNLSMARATLRKLGNVLFDNVARQAEAESHLYAGRQAEARKLLEEALTLAKERKLTNRVVSLTTDLADSYFLTGEYEAARALLEEVARSAEGQGDLGAQIELGKVYVRLGDFESASSHLERALAGVGGQGDLAPDVYSALGELAYESGMLVEARARFAQAAALWTTDLPNAASIEAKCYQGLLETSPGRIQVARRSVEEAVAQSKRMGRLYLETRCRLHLARIYLRERRYAEAVAALDAIPSDGERTIGPELRAQVRYWRGRATAERGDRAGATSDLADAQTLMQQFQTSLPEQYRDRFASRPDIQTVVSRNGVRKRS